MRWFFFISAAFLIFISSAFSFTIKWSYTQAENYDRMTFGASAALVNLGPDVNISGGEAHECMEVITGSDEYSSYFWELGTTAVGIWRCIDALGNLEWAVDTRTDESRSSIAVMDFYDIGDGYLEITGGTTSGWNVETMDRLGNFLWTFPSPPETGGPFMWHSSPAVADVLPSLPGLEIVIGNNPCSSIWCFQSDPSDAVDDGIHYDVSGDIDCFYIYTPPSGGTDGIDYDVLWRFDTYAAVISTPALGDMDNDGDIDVVFGDGYETTYGGVSESGGYIYCLDGPTGTLRWQLPTGGAQPVVDASPAIADFDDDGDLEIIIGARNGNLYLIDGDEDTDGSISASEMTTVVMGGAVHSSAAIVDVDGDGIYEIIAASNAGAVQCISYSPPTTASVIWTTPLDTAIISSPAIACATDTASWTHFCHDPMRTNFYADSGRIKIIVCTMGGKVYCLDGASGTIEDDIDLGTYIHTSPTVADIDLDCELEVVVTVCNDPYGFGLTDPDIIYCLGTGLYNPDCMECGEISAWRLCPVDSVLPISSCPTQKATFAITETTLWDHPDTSHIFARVNIYHIGGSETHFVLQGIASTMNFTVLPRDSIEIDIWHNWLHGDSVIITLDSMITVGNCTNYTAESIFFLIDLEPPIISAASGMPANGATIAAGTFEIEYIAEDDIAGFRESLSELDVFIHHPEGIVDSYFVSGALCTTITAVDNDSIVVYVTACDSIYDYGCSCEPNCATDTFWYLIEGHGPIADIITPPEDVISACRDQEIWIAINDSDGVDETTIIVVISGDTFYCSDTELEFSNDTLILTPSPGFWSDGDTVIVELLAADDLYGNLLQNSPLERVFYMDFAPPTATMTSPPESSFTLDQYEPVSIEFLDNLAGLWVDCCSISFGNHDFTLGELAPHITNHSTSGALTFRPEDWGIVWQPGDTVRIDVWLCDYPDTCSANCEEYSWWFCLPADHDCTRKPNPFTPNGDGVNDKCQFTFPGLAYEEGEIYIFNLYNVEVRKIFVPVGEGAKQGAIWNALNNDGEHLPQGLYLYVIEVGGEIVCKGTITIAR